MPELTYIPSLLLPSSSSSYMPGRTDKASSLLSSLSSSDISEISEESSLPACDELGLLFALSVFSSLERAIMATSWPVFFCMALSCGDIMALFNSVLVLLHSGSGVCPTSGALRARGRERYGFS